VLVCLKSSSVSVGQTLKYPGVQEIQRGRPTKGQNWPNEMGKIELKFDKLFSAWKMGHI
jgi:hypothetical protein